MHDAGTHDPESPTTRSLLARIAAKLDVSVASFGAAGRPDPTAAGPSTAECEEAMMLFRCVESPERRAAVVRLLRAMIAKS